MRNSLDIDIKERLVLSRPLPILEQIILEEYSLLNRLQKKRRTKRYRPFRKKQELQEALHEVTLWADEFLEVPADVEYPEIFFGKNTVYDPMGRIVIERRAPYPVQTVFISHEYAHFLQDELLGINMGDCNDILMEGHARGVEKHCAKWYAKKKVSLPLLETLKVSLMELTRAYEYFSFEFKKIPPKRLADLIKQYIPKGLMGEKCMVDHYDLGNTFFSIAEKQYGPKIYAQTLKKDFSFFNI